MAGFALAPACLTEMASVARLATVIVAGRVWVITGCGEAVAPDGLFFSESAAQVSEDTVGLAAEDSDGGRRPDLVIGGVLGYATSEFGRQPGSVEARLTRSPGRPRLPSSPGDAVPRVVANFNGAGRAEDVCGV
jgi:hypothetical protein